MESELPSAFLCNARGRAVVCGDGLGNLLPGEFCYRGCGGRHGTSKKKTFMTLLRANYVFLSEGISPFRLQKPWR